LALLFDQVHPCPDALDHEVAIGSAYDQAEGTGSKGSHGKNL